MYNKDTVNIAIILTLSIAVTYGVLSSQGVPLHGDMTIPVSLNNYIADIYPLWNSYGSYSNYEDIDRFLFMTPIFVVSMFFDLSTGTVFKFVLLILLLSSSISMYYFSLFILKRIYENEQFPVYIPLISAIIYTYSPWVLEQIQAQFYWLAYAITPMILMNFIKLLDTKRFKYVIITAALWSLASSTPHYTILTGILLFIYIMFALITDLIRKNTKEMYSKSAIFALLILTYLLINSYWIIPYIQNSQVEILSPGYMVTKEQIQTFSRNSNILNVIRTFDQWITWFVPDVFNSSMWKLNSFVLPILSLSTLLIKKIRNNYYIRFFSFIYIITVIFSLGANLPFYDRLVFDTPFSGLIGWVWRVPGKLSYTIWLVYSLFIGIFISELSLRLNCNDKYSKYSTKIMLVISVIILCSYAFTVGPKVYAYFGFYYKPIDMPEEYSNLNKWLASQKGDFKVMYLAPYECGLNKNKFKYGTSFTWNPDRLAGHDLSRMSPKPSIGAYHFTSPWKQYYAFIYPDIPKDIDKYLAFLNVRYLVYHHDLVGTEKCANIDMIKLNQSNLIFKKSFNFVKIYENPNYNNHIFVPKEELMTVGGLEILKFVPQDIGIIFVEQDRNIFNEKLHDTYSLLNNSLIMYDDPKNVYMSLIPQEYVVKLSKHTNYYEARKRWAKTSTFNRFQGMYGWHSFLRWQKITDRFYFDYGDGVVMTRAINSTIRVPISVDTQDTYVIYARLLEKNSRGLISFTVENKTIFVDTRSTVDNFTWNYICTINLSKGNHDIYIKNMYGYNVVNSMIVIPQDKLPVYMRYIEQISDDKIIMWNKEKNKGNKDFFIPKDPPASISNHVDINSALYKVNVSANRPFMLALSESYDIFWTAKIDKINGKSVDSEIIRPIPLYSVINGFWINQTGDLNITIEYEPQRWFYVGSAISIVTLIASIGYLLYDWRKRRRHENR